MADRIGRTDAEVRSQHAALRDELRDDAVDGVDGDGEPDARGDTAGADDRGVDADESPGTVEEWAAGVSGIDGGVGLDEVFDVSAIGGGKRSTQRRDDADGERLVEAERIADGENLLADLKIVTRADRDRAKLAGARVDAQDGQVVVRGDADEVGVVGVVVPEGDGRA